MAKKNQTALTAFLIALNFFNCASNKGDTQDNHFNKRSGSKLVKDCSESSLQWVYRDPFPDANALKNVTYGNGVFVAIADGGTVFVSRNAINWRRIQTCTWHNLNDLAFGNGKFVAVGDSGSIYVSQNGQDWHDVKSGTRLSLKSVTYGSGKFVVVGEKGTGYISENAENWKLSQVTDGGEIRFVTFGAGVFVAASYPDEIYKSLDAVNWQRIASRGLPKEEFYIYNVLYVRDHFMVTGYMSNGSGSGSAVILASKDGTVWERKDAGIPYSIVRVCFSSNDHYYAGTSGLINNNCNIYTSTDLSSWSILCDSAPYLSDCKYVNGSFLGVGSLFIGKGSYGKIFSSNDAKIWESRLSQTQKFNITVYCGIAYGASKFVLSDASGTISTSQDGVTWMRQVSKIGAKINSFQYKAGRFVATGEDGSIFLSPDALVWKPVENTSSSEFMPGVSVKGICVAVGKLGMVITRKSDSSWVRCKTESDNQLNDVAFGAGKFVAIGDNGTILSSTDGLNWNPETAGTSEDLKDIEYAAGRFMAVGYYGCIISSSDGKQWRRELSGTTRFLYSVTYGAGQYLVAGQAILSMKFANSSDTVTSNDKFIGLWTLEDFSDGKAGFVSSDSSIILQQINIQQKTVFTMPEIPLSGESKESFIPSDWEVMEEADGDLNGDNLPDIAMVIKYSKSDYIINSGNGPAISQPRILLILFKENGKNTYHLAAQNSSIIIESTDPTLEEPFGGMEIKNRVLSLSFSFFYNMGTWEVTGYKYRFRYQNGSFVLIGEDHSSFWRNGANPSEETSCNYLTGKKRTIIENSFDESSKPETTWSKIGRSEQTLESMGDTGD